MKTDEIKDAGRGGSCRDACPQLRRRVKGCRRPSKSRLFGGHEGQLMGEIASAGGWRTIEECVLRVCYRTCAAVRSGRSPVR